MPLLSDEQILRARDIDLLSYLQTHEPGNVRKNHSGEYYMVEHDSLKMSNGKWFRHSTQQGGHSALDFLIKVRGVPFVDAVQSLTDGYVISSYQAKSAQKASPPAPPKPFTLPKPNRMQKSFTHPQQGLPKLKIYGMPSGLAYGARVRRSPMVTILFTESKPEGLQLWNSLLGT